MRKRKLAFGVGVNDADYQVHTALGICPYFRAWHNMLKRCYCASYQKTQPTYEGCTVCDEWLTFSNFKAWMKKQDWRWNELDKDIAKPGNRVYSPATCLFVAREINALLNNRRQTAHPQGTYFDKHAGKYRAEITIGGRKRYIGVYDSEKDAGRAYRNTKAAHLRTVAMKQVGRVKRGLLRHADALSCRA